MITLKLLRVGFNRTPVARLQLFLPHLQEAERLAQLDTIPRVAAFLAQIGHESGRLRYVREIWGPTAQQLRYERDFTRPWSARDARNRLAFNLGNTRRGDGLRYAGHGLIQVTGAYNHKRATVNLGRLLNGTVPDFYAEPLALTAPRWAALTAAEYWVRLNLNQYSDSRAFQTQTRRINGGLNGLADRMALNTAFTTALVLGEA